MPKSTLFFLLLLLSALAFHLGRQRSLQVADGRIANLHSLPGYYGYFTALWCGMPALFILLLWLGFETSCINHLILAELPAELRELPRDRQSLLLNEIRNMAEGKIELRQEMASSVEYYRGLRKWSNDLLAILAVSTALLGGIFAWYQIAPKQRARNAVEKAVMGMLIGCSLVAVLTTVGIVLSVLFESMRFFEQVPVSEFLFGLNWSPQVAIRSDQVGSSGAFGAVPLFTGTLLISAIAMLVAVPIGLLSAIYLAEYATPGVRAVTKPLLEILAGIPTVVYGFFAALTVAPCVRDLGEQLGLSVSSESALAAGLVMGVMIIPFVSSLSDDFINAVPQSLRDGAYALGATRSETIRQVVIPAALPGIVGGILLAVSRAIGETMIVVMAAGLSANLTANPLEAVTTVTTQIVTLLVGDQEFDSPKTLAAFALGLVLFAVTLALNILALYIVRKYREQYE
ncbi:MAG: phosphate ABC transporter permease subunit PstC [Kiritimatiellae bacterium]|nr:phosphate ABC transporter permease subunit PstC [Kiritimatiellia bacterium]